MSGVEVISSKPRKKRRLARGLLWLVAAGILWLGLLPLWFPWVLKPVAEHYGLRFAEYDRIGWTRLVLTGVQGSWGGARLEAQRVESALPVTWFWGLLGDSKSGAPLLYISGGQLSLEVPATNAVKDAGPGSPGSMDETLKLISQTGLRLQQISPVAGLTNCRLQLGTYQVSIPSAHWQAGRLQADLQTPSVQGTVALACRQNGDLTLDISAGWKTFEVSLQGGCAHTLEGWRWNGVVSWLTNRAELTARFPVAGWWPAQAQVNAQRWLVPPEFLPVRDWKNLSVSLAANLVSNRFDLRVDGMAQPSDLLGQKGWTNVDFSLRADGDPHAVTLRELEVQAPWLKAGLRDPVGLLWTSPWLTEPARLGLSMNLEGLPEAALKGQAEGVLILEPRAGQLPLAQFRFSAASVSAAAFNAQAILVRGELAAPILKFHELKMDFADGSKLVAEGSLDIDAGRLEAGRWEFSGGDRKPLLPALSYASLSARGEVQGPLTHLTHRGEAALTRGQITGLKPADVRVRWNGQNLHLAALEVEWSAGKSSLSLGAVADLDPTEREAAVTLKRVSLRQGTNELYTLPRPGTIQFKAKTGDDPGAHWTLAVEDFNWQGARQSLACAADLAWPAQGYARLTMNSIEGADFSDFFAADIAHLSLTELALTAQWSNGPVHAAILVSGSMTNAGRLFRLRGALKTGEVLTLEELTLANANLPALSVKGTVPVKIIPGTGRGMLAWDMSQSVALAGSWQDAQSEPFAIPLGAGGQLALSQPALEFRISGPPLATTTELTGRAAKVAWQPAAHPSLRPTLDDLQFTLEIRPEQVRLKSFTTKLEGQRIVAHGEWPLPEAAWTELWSARKLPDWQQARGGLELEAAPLAAFSPYLPEVLSPEGSVRAALELKAGLQLEGVLSLTNAATRPLGPISPLREVTARVRFDGQQARLEYFLGQIGGQPVRADSYLTRTPTNGSGWDCQVNLRGTNVPFARSPELLLRGDFAVSLRAGNAQPPLISGTVNLRDGLLVQQASSLVTSAPQRPELRPPYFRVTNEPFAQWKVDLAIRGNNSLRMRTPIISGIASADLQVRGTLLEPVVTGDARVDSGRLTFPFGSLQIDQGLANLSTNSLQGPDLQIKASGRNYRYDIRLEVTGPAEGANVVFSSTPSLTSEQILLLLTAGQIPQSDYTFSSSARAQRLGTFLGKDLLSRYFGSDPAKERFIIRTGENISDTGRLTYSLEYRLTDRYSIIAEYDEYNAINTDLKWKLFTR